MLGEALRHKNLLSFKRRTKVYIRAHCLSGKL